VDIKKIGVGATVVAAITVGAVSLTQAHSACGCSTPVYVGADTTAPTVAMSAPSNGASVSGSTVTVSATASDNVAVVGVQFQLDGANLGSEDTSSPYSISWDSTATTDGTHTLQAIARDAAGNRTTATSVSVSVSNSGGATTANLWVSSSGSSACTRNASAVTYSAAVAAGNVCDTGPHAYSKASLGDTVLIESSTFTSQWNFTKTISKSGTTGTCNYNYGGTSNFSNCVTFAPAAGQTFTFDVAGSTQPQVLVCANFVSIQGAVTTETDYTDSFGDTVSNDAYTIGEGDNTCGSTAIHDIYLKNDTLGGRMQIQGGAINVWQVGGAITSLKDLSPQIGNGGGNNGLIANTNHSGIVGVTFDGFNFADTDPGHHHMECLHDSGGSNHITIASDRFLGCPVESAFFQTLGSPGATGFGPVQDNILIENNFFDNGGADALKVDCTNTDCQNTNITVRFNTFVGSLFAVQNACNSNGTCSGAVINNDLVYGNIGLGCPAIGFGTTGVTGSLWTTSYNVQTGPKQNICTGDSTSSYSQTVTLVSPASPNYNDDLSGAQTAVNFVPNTVTWPLSGANIHGTARTGTTTNAGAD
jgi:hypothetical protein